MREMVTVDVVRAQHTDREKVGGVLARAFQEDPVFRWVVPDPARRRAQLPLLFAIFADFFLVHDETYLVEGAAGVALWAPAGVDPIAEHDLASFGERAEAALQDDVERAWQLQGLLDEHHPEEPAFYLQFMGVVPEHQRRGLGSRLLTTVLERCDASGTPAYLEATSADNRRLYAAHGFETVAQIAVPGGPELWPMGREPVTRDG